MSRAIHQPSEPRDGATSNLKFQTTHLKFSVRRILSTVGFVLTTLLFAAAVWYWLRPLPRLADVRRWADRGEWERANVAIRAFLARRPQDPEALLLAGRVAAGRGDLERCVKLLQRVPQDSPLKPEALTRQAQAALAMNSARQAEATWRELLRLTGHDPSRAVYRRTAQAELVALLSLERRSAEVQAELWEMVPDHSEKWRVLIGLLRGHLRGSTPKSAIEALERFVEHDPTDFKARRGLAQASMDTFECDRAIDLAKDCLEMNPTDSHSLEILLECYLRQEQWHAMNEIFVSRAEKMDTSPRMVRLRAKYYEATGQLDLAERCFRESLNWDSMDSTTHYQFAQLLQRRGKTDEAQEHIAEFKRLKNHEDALVQLVAKYQQSDAENWTAPNPDTCVEVAEHCLGLGRSDEARAWFHEALRQQPQHPAAREGLESMK